MRSKEADIIDVNITTKEKRLSNIVGVFSWNSVTKNLHTGNKYFALVGASFSGKSVGHVFPQQESFRENSHQEI